MAEELERQRDINFEKLKLRPVLIQHRKTEAAKPDTPVSKPEPPVLSGPATEAQDTAKSGTPVSLGTPVAADPPPEVTMVDVSA